MFSVVQIMQLFTSKIVLNYCFSGLLQRVNEMQYADRQNAFQREAANMEIRQRVVGAHADDVAGNSGENAEVPVPPAQNHGNFMFLLEQEQEQGPEQEQEQGQEQHPGPNYNDNQDDQVPPAHDQPQAMPIPIPEPGNRRERRPYHALARENAEALDALLTREIPVLTQQLQQTMELMKQLIRRQLDD